MQVGRRAGLPLRHGTRADPFGIEGEVAGDAERSGRRQRLQHRFEEGHIAVGRLDEQLGVAVALHLLLQAAQDAHELVFLARQIAVEGELLSVEARGHQCQQERRRAYKRHHLDAFLVCLTHQQGPGVGHRRAARFGQQPQRVALPHRSEQPPDRVRRGVFVQLFDVQFGDGKGRIGRFDEAACRPRTLGHEMAQRMQVPDDVGRDGVDGLLAQGRRDEVEGRSHSGFSDKGRRRGCIWHVAINRVFCHDRADAGPYCR